MGKLLAAALVALVTGCNYGAASFHCTSDTQCGAGGRCEQSYGGLCSFSVDPAICPSGYRFGDLAGPQSNQCVGAQPVDAGVDTPVDVAIDAAIDAPPDAPPCFGSGFLTICLQNAPSGPLPISNPRTVDTSNLSASMCEPLTSGGDFCVLAGTDITISAKLRGIGVRPLVLVASGSITTTAAGLIDVGSHRILPAGTTESGAGADPAAFCTAGTLPGTTAGGAGGSFLGVGGNGGSGGNGGAGGIAAPRVTTVTALRGGCAGQNGQGGAGEFGLAGRGGGAVYLIAGVRIDIQGGINAAGEGGGGGIANSGGAGGGGSGGMIGFDAPSITATSLLLASGGGGGGGAGSGGTPGSDVSGGNAPDPTVTAAAAGGMGFVGNNTFGGNGGNGSVATTTAPGEVGRAGDTGGQNKGGGGGGGGGTGLIKAPDTANLGSNLSPPRSP
ncbi:MAG TPA: hypothetical protein VGD80_08725 [Kofleriaceae bacterium]